MALLHAQTAVITVPESNAVDFVYTDPTNVSRYAWKPSGKITFNKVITSSFVIGVYWSKISSKKQTVPNRHPLCPLNFYP